MLVLSLLHHLIRLTSVLHFSHKLCNTDEVFSAYKAAFIQATGHFPSEFMNNVVTPAKDVLLCNHAGVQVPYTVRVGLDTMLTLALDEDWSAEKYAAVRELRIAHPDGIPEVNAPQILAQYGLTDFGWNWVTKVGFCSTDDYEWFYLIAEGKTQAVCIIYHPKPSVVDGQRIFYIDYIASAYWNRNRPAHRRRFSSVGTKLISFAIKHATENLGYRPGFSLHSLPTAEAYYVSLGITPYECDSKKEGLRYFEADAACAMGLLEANNA